MNLMDTQLADTCQDKPFWLKGLISGVIWVISWYLCYLIIPHVMGLAALVPILAGLLQLQFLKSKEIKKAVLSGGFSLVSSKLIWIISSLIIKGIVGNLATSEQAFNQVLMVMFFQMIVEIIVLAIAIMTAIHAQKE